MRRIRVSATIMLALLLAAGMLASFSPLLGPVHADGEWVSPTGYDDEGATWSDESNTYDEDTNSRAEEGGIPAGEWGNYLELILSSAVNCDKVRFWAKQDVNRIDQISLDVYYDSEWHNIYEGSYASREWVEKTIPAGAQSVDRARAKFHNNDDGARNAEFYEFDFWEEVIVSTVTTQAADDILDNSATGHGTIVALNNGNCTVRGFDWDTDSGAPYANEVTEEGDYGTGAYSKSLTGLPEGTTIFCRAKAYNSLGWGYGNEVTFATTGGTPPTVSTSSAASLTTTGATLQGVLTSLGTYTPIYTFFQYGLTTSYGTSTEEQTMTDTGGFNEPISGLSPGTLYHFRAVARHGADSYVYGLDNSFTTAALGAPSVTYNDAADIGETGATLQGTLTSLGDYSPVYVSFEYGLTTSYGTSTEEETMTSAGAFTAAISGLTSSTTYHYRPRVRYDSSYAYGDDVAFTTAGIGLAPPTSFAAARGDNTVTLSWIKNTEAINTLVRRSTAGYPNSISSGTQVYFGTGTGVIDTGRENAQAYYYSAWSERDGEYSSSYSTTYSASSGTGVGVLAPPDILRIYSVLVVETYQDKGDQLIAVAYNIGYFVGVPSQNAEDFFAIELYSGTDLVARSPVMDWGHMPGSIYLSPSNAMTWLQSFTVKIAGLAGQWGAITPEVTFSAAASNWAGDRSSLDQLDEWVFTVADSIDPEWVEFTTSGDRLSDEACDVFNEAIRGLSSVRTEVCQSGVSYPPYEPPSHGDAGQQNLTREKNLGDYINGLLDDAGDMVGMDGGTMGTMIMAFLCLAMLVAVGAMSRSVGWAMVSTIPIIAFGNFIGLIGLAFTLIVASIIAMYLYYTIWLRGI